MAEELQEPTGAQQDAVPDEEAWWLGHGEKKNTRKEHVCRSVWSRCCREGQGADSISPRERGGLRGCETRPLFFFSSAGRWEGRIEQQQEKERERFISQPHCSDSPSSPQRPVTWQRDTQWLCNLGDGVAICLEGEGRRDRQRAVVCLAVREMKV
ncbi:hypothetical protein AOLI_G00107950 [Acnodon oligacanthus]